MSGSPHLRVSVELDHSLEAGLSKAELTRAHRPRRDAGASAAELNGAADHSRTRPSQDPQRLPAGDWILLATVLEAGCEPPAGYVQHGSARWRFVNRVELLEAIDAAYRDAGRPHDHDAPPHG